MKEFLWILFSVLGVICLVMLIKDYIAERVYEKARSWIKPALIGFVGNFFDTLGIGSFALETALFRFTKQVDDRLIPGTLNAGNAIPTIAQAVIFIHIVEVESVTLLSMVVASGVGAYIGAGVVSKLNVRFIRITMGVALFISAGFMLSKQLHWLGSTGEAISLQGNELLLGIGVNFILGALMTAGVGLYAPCMAFVFMMGMNQQVAFPIMMSSCAFLMCVSTFRFIRDKAYCKKSTLPIAIFGVPGVLLAAYFFSSLSVTMLLWVVMGVIVYTASTMLYRGLKHEG